MSEYQLDTRRYRCPLPLLMTKQALRQLQADDELKVWLNQESAVEDFRLLCETQSCLFENLSTENAVIIRKTPESAEK